jgi:alpha-glucosidase
MAWDGSPHAGFSTAEPWLPLHADWRTRNVAAQLDDPDSMLALYRGLLRLRRAHPALATGRYEAIAAEGNVIAFRRGESGEQFHIALNLGGADQRMPPVPGRFEPVMSTLPGRLSPSRDHLRPDEGIIFREM